ncbi:hypothetical protein BJ322DRAFT_1110591 [Thelephora terrestris]|uniref:Uncharacterized protein n=1 Tax=Thelephora terrestris TaxID=56493 RepID=A0A9P6HAP4_9AGAM|nr:hypothetical protein BJ322DRAFT_1110591 [Thelephora terrestris]
MSHESRPDLLMFGPSTLAKSDKENCRRCPLQPISQLVKIEDEVMEVARAKDAPRVAEDPAQASNEGDRGLLFDYVDSAAEQSPSDGDVGPGVPQFGDIWEADWSAQRSLFLSA